MFTLESCAGRVNPRGLPVSAELWCVSGAWYEILCSGNTMFTQCTWKWYEQEIQCYTELVVQRCSDILQWWRDHRWSFWHSVILQGIRSVWWQPALLVKECLVSTVMLWIEEKQIERVRQWTTYSFSTVLWERSAECWLQVSHFYFTGLFEGFCWP